MKKNWLLARVAFALCALFTSQTHAGYIVTDLGTLGGTGSHATGINDAGVVTGWSYLPGNSTAHGFRWSNGVMSDLPTNGGLASEAHRINNNGLIVGYANSSGSTAGKHATRWSTSNSPTDLGTLGGSTSDATDINSSGTIVGWSYNNNDQQIRGFVRSPSGQFTDLGSMGGLNTSQAFGINDAGQITGGTSIPAGSQYHAFRYSGGVMTDLGGLGGDSVGLDINAGGDVVGYSYLTGNTDWHAVRWSAAGGVTDLGTFGGRASQANAINTAGQIVGQAYNTNVTIVERAFLYENGQLINLNTQIPAGSGWVLREATDINNSGQIVGWGNNPSGAIHAFLLTPEVPEPGMMGILGAVLFLGGRRVRGG